MAEYVQNTLGNVVNSQPPNSDELRSLEFPRTPSAPRPEYFEILQPEMTISRLSELYIDSLSPKEKKAYLIARDHLGMSFTLEKSVGFLQWKKQYSPTLQSIK